MRLDILYFDQQGNQLDTRDGIEFCALACNGRILDYFASEEAAVEALFMAQSLIQEEVKHVR